MIIQALTACYDQLLVQEKVDRPGWQRVNVSYEAEIDAQGALLRLNPLLRQEIRGKKTVWLPTPMSVPALAKRASNVKANFLCDNCTYFFGIDIKGNPERALKCFLDAKRLHTELLSGLSSSAAQAVVRFFQRWEPAAAATHPAIAPVLNDLMSGVNLIFSFCDRPVQTDPDIQKVWDGANEDDNGLARMRCLVTGNVEPIARLHPSIKGIFGGNPTGTTLVSFNKPAFESRGWNGGQGNNAPVGQKSAFAYTTALNYLIDNRSHHMQIGDMTVVFWAEDGQDAYAQLARAMLGDDVGLTQQDLASALTQLASGRSIQWNEALLSPDQMFYILGLAPNAARISVRFFWQNRFGAFAENMAAHQERLNIVRPKFDSDETLSFRRLLGATVNPNSKDKTPSPILGGALMRSVLNSAPYPALLLNLTEIRIRAEHKISRERAAIIKAYLLLNTRQGERYDDYKEVLSVELNENAAYSPYLLGRLFAILESLQESANPGINATIRDRYFNSACATPAVVFPQLIKLAQAHLKKLDPGLSHYYNGQIAGILGRLSSSYPQRLSLNDQGIFQLGYYHQVQKRYEQRQ